ncbi:MAG: MFS transporter [Bauldia sp.]
MLTVDPFTGHEGADWLIVGRIVQGIGAAFLVANSAAILTDAFPANQRGLALGINNIAGISGSFIGLILGGVLAAIDWRLVFLVSVPFGLFGTVWSYLKLKELGERHRAGIDWAGNITFALGLILIMIGITYGIQPADGASDGMDERAGHLAAGRRRGLPHRVRRRRDAERRADVPPAAVQDPGVHVRHALDIPVGRLHAAA